MNNIDIFIKYLDNSISEEEKLYFEKRLSNEIELKKDFDEFKNLFDSAKKEIRVDERYFSTILPNTIKRIDEKQKLLNVFLPIYKLRYIIPIFLLGAFVVYRLFISVPSANSQPGIDQIVTELAANDNAAQQILNETIQNSNDLQYDQNVYSMVYDEDEYDKLLFKYAEANKNTIEITDSLINQLSENEFNLVYNEMINKKIL